MCAFIGMIHFYPHVVSVNDNSVAHQRHSKNVMCFLDTVKAFKTQTEPSRLLDLSVFTDCLQSHLTNAGNKESKSC